MRARAGLTTLVAVLALGACTDEAAEPGEPGKPGENPAPAGLNWQSTDESPEDTVVVGAQWRAVVPSASPTGVLRRGSEQVELTAPAPHRITQVLMSDTYAVLVATDPAERRPALGLTVDLADGSSVELGGPRPAPGGSWALHGDELRYPTYGPNRAYCLATTHLPSGESQLDHCAPKGEGFSQVTISDSGTALMTFDDARPVSCRTLVTLTDNAPAPVAGVEPCVGWDVAATPSGAVWSEAPEQGSVGEGVFFASHDGSTTELGAGATGTLTACGDSVFFVRSAAGEEPARLVRVHDGVARVAWQAPRGGQGFLSPPACAGDVVTLTYLGESGDQQLWASTA